MYIIDIAYKADITVIEPHLAAHRAYLDLFYAQGLLLCSGPKNPRTGGVIVGLFKSLKEAEEFTHDDPYYKQGIASYHITEFTPVKHVELLMPVINQMY